MAEQNPRCRTAYIDRGGGAGGKLLDFPSVFCIILSRGSILSRPGFFRGDGVAAASMQSMQIVLQGRSYYGHPVRSASSAAMVHRGDTVNSSKLRGRINEVENYGQLEALFREVESYNEKNGYEA